MVAYVETNTVRAIDVQDGKACDERKNWEDGVLDKPCSGHGLCDHQLTQVIFDSFTAADVGEMPTCAGTKRQLKLPEHYSGDALSEFVTQETP